MTGGASWAVPMRHRDGTISRASDTGNLSGFHDTVDVQKRKFLDKGLNTQDLVTLVVSNCRTHTVGTSASQFFSYRLYNFTSTGPDPLINPAFVSQLQELCPQNGDGSRRIGLDTGSANRFDNSGLLGLTFNVEFGKSMVKMSNVEMKTGTAGEIRKVCSRIN
ncbi:Cationic peroxidase 2 [Hibiscus syriacus]|uniref:peroxidase n=1 Tax=Hibiscus syriacus TaxID=106335 RepID=A0A6A2Z4I8_HIBSY|nr:Cationic peroxidase 2 [Hibiscus syriacus]